MESSAHHDGSRAPTPEILTAETGFDAIIDNRFMSIPEQNWAVLELVKDIGWL